MGKNKNQDFVVVPYDRENSKKQQVEQMFNRIATKYDLLNDILSFGIEDHWKKTLIRLVKHYNPQKVLDIATGTGDLLVLMSKKLRPQRLVGIDISAQMLELAKQKLRKKLGEKADNIELYRQDGENLQCKDEEFDLVTCAFGVRNFENLVQGLKQIHRVTKNGGIVAILEFSKVRNKFFSRLYTFYFEKILPYLGGLIAKDFKAYKYLPESVKYFPDGQEFIDLVENLGFKSVRTKILTFGIATIYIFKKIQ